MRWIITGTTTSAVHSCCAVSDSVASGSNLRRRTSVEDSAMPSVKCTKPQEWNRGAAIIVVSRALSGILDSSAAAGSSVSGWAREAPFGVPVVPEVRIVVRPGSALPGPLAERWMDLFGDNIYNLYGSTEVAWATIATPRDLREAPGTAGRPPYGTVVKLYDDDGNPVTEPGETGRIFVGNQMQFEGYTGGGGKDVIDGLLSSGDVGHFDETGRLFVDGRDDDMIVSGGENVFPAEVEDLLSGMEQVSEVAVFGVDDEEFGQRLKAVVVLRDGASLSEDDVKQHVKSNLAGYKVPRDVEFVDELPRTATGKVLKRELQDKERQQA